MDMLTACSGDAEFVGDPSYVEGEDCFAWVITRAYLQYEALNPNYAEDPNLRVGDPGLYTDPLTLEESTYDLK